MINEGERFHFCFVVRSLADDSDEYYKRDDAPKNQVTYADLRKKNREAFASSPAAQYVRVVDESDLGQMNRVLRAEPKFARAEDA